MGQHGEPPCPQPSSIEQNRLKAVAGCIRHMGGWAVGGLSPRVASAREHHERASAPEERSEDCQLEPAEPESAPTCAEVQREQGLGQAGTTIGVSVGVRS